MLVDAPQQARPDAVFIPIGDAAEKAAIGLIAGLRREGIACEMAFKGNMKKRMQKGNEAKTRYAIIIGDNELENGQVALKDMSSGDQRMVPVDKLEAVMWAQKVGDDYPDAEDLVSWEKNRDAVKGPFQE